MSKRILIVERVHRTQPRAGNKKLHYAKVYENISILGRVVSIMGIIAKTQELSNNQDFSVTAIMDVMSTLQMMSNTNTQSVNTMINTIRQEIATLRTQVQASRQMMANNTT